MLRSILRLIVPPAWMQACLLVGVVAGSGAAVKANIQGLASAYTSAVEANAPSGITSTLSLNPSLWPNSGSVTAGPSSKGDLATSSVTVTRNLISHSAPLTFFSSHTSSTMVAASTLLYFTVDGQSDYDLSGSLQVTSTKASQQYQIRQSVSLYDLTRDNGYSFFENDSGFQAGDHTFQLGTLDIKSPGGKYDLQGSLSGLLVAGHTYMFNSYFSVSSVGDANIVALGSTDLRVTSPGAAVPAPGAAILVFIGFSMIGWIRRRFD